MRGNTRSERQGGAIIPLVAVSLLALLGFAALAIDVGYLFVVRNELQNAADTAALAGASYLFKSTPPSPNWDAAEAEASNAITQTNNKAANVALATGTITTGYWDLTGAIKGIQSSSITPRPNIDFPAVKVEITKSGNNGVVNAFFAQALGIATFSPRAISVAVVTGPGYTNQNFPFTIDQCLFDKYWDSTTGQPKPVDGSYDITIGSTYHYSGCGSIVPGQWSSLSIDSNAASYVTNLVDDFSNGIEHKLAIGTEVYIQPGTEASLYKKAADCSGKGDKTCEYVTAPIVCPNPPACDGALDPKSHFPIVAFACLNILSANQGEKTITVRMVGSNDPYYSKCKVSGGGVGPAYGSFLHPRLANYYDNTY
ncbi:MAG: pilus assembly protein TadG-related protein [Methylococcaceae bacterium]|nr:pilus assembly protein TadG-related protein [Methylococcaceae bacterium]